MQSLAARAGRRETFRLQATSLNAHPSGRRRLSVRISLVHCLEGRPVYQCQRAARRQVS